MKCHRQASREPQGLAIEKGEAAGKEKERVAQLSFPRGSLGASENALVPGVIVGFMDEETKIRKSKCLAQLKHIYSEVAS